MRMTDDILPKMPDVAASQRPQAEGPLDRVGMGQVEALISLELDGRTVLLPAEVDVFVSLDDPKAKGIHMSRMYKIVIEQFEQNAVDFGSLHQISEDLLDSHVGLSSRSFLEVRFQFPVRRKALLSDNQGLRHYPVVLRCEKSPRGTVMQLGLEVQYSSTCPCSAALARQLIQKQFSDRFANSDLNFDEVHSWLGSSEGIMATPHSQRSVAKIRLDFNTESGELPILKTIDCAEEVLKTAVQSAVKREDEQEFARLNGQNPMFCEDAARKLREQFLSWSDLEDFQIEVRHLESLHPHDAVAWASKSSSHP